MVRTPTVEVHARNPTVRAGLRELLARSGLDVVEGTRALGGVSDVDVLLIDAPGGVQGDPRSSVFTVESDGIPTIFLVDRLPPEAQARSSRSATARGWLRRDASEDELAAGVRAVAAGLQVIDPLLEPQTDGRVPSTTLTERERDILHLLAQNRSNTEIAQASGLTAKTVSNYVSNILAKLQVADRAQAILRAREAGLGQT